MIRKPIVAISCGDPAGVGSEIALKVASDKKIKTLCLPVITGARTVLEETKEKFFPDLNLKPLNSSKLNKNDIYYEDFDKLKIKKFTKGKVSAEAGKLAYQTIVQTTKATIKNNFDAIVTAPVNKEAINLAGYKFQGHTELIASLCKCDNFVMMQSSNKLKVAFMSNHIALSETKHFITKNRFQQVAHLFNNALKLELNSQPKIAVAGFNPHAGENGFIGSEENKILIPAIKSLKNKIDLHGPFPADTLFINSKRQQFDGIICMYHDQGHIPFKMLSFDDGVNCTLGLPIIRTSVDHGTAFDIAWQGKASSTSLEQAIEKSVAFFHKKTQLI